MAHDLDDLAARFSKLSPKHPQGHKIDETAQIQGEDGAPPSPTVERMITDIKIDAKTQGVEREDVSQVENLLREGKAALECVARDDEVDEGSEQGGHAIDSEQLRQKRASDKIGVVDDEVSADELQAILDELGVEDEYDEVDGHECNKHDDDDNHDEDCRSDLSHETDELQSRLRGLGRVRNDPDENRLQLPSAPTEISLEQGPLDFLFPSAPSNDVTTITRGKASKSRSETEGGAADADADAVAWCIICCADAAVSCVGCEGDLYCHRCWSEGHQGPDAGYEEQRHKYKAFEKRKKKLIAA